MSRLLYHKVPNDWRAEDSKIPYEIQDLMSYKFIFVPQSILIDYSKIIYNNSIIQRSTLCEAVFLQYLYIL